MNTRSYVDPINRTREYWEEAVKGPGKFEGCQPWAAYYYETGLNGGGDELLSDLEENGHFAERYKVSASEAVLFPELSDVEEVVLVEDGQGFVYTFEGLEEYAEWLG